MGLWRAAQCLVVLIPALLAGGCAGYKLGPTGELRARDKSIQVNPVVNSTVEPRVGAAVTQALRQELQQDGTFRLDTRGQGDVVLNTEIVRFNRREMTFQPGDTITPVDYEISLIAKVVATDRATGRELLNKEVKGRLIVRIGSDLVSAERQSLPTIAADLARNITVLLVDGEW